ncbi:unnamed protein product [Wickerhamomyces anomalus]
MDQSIEKVILEATNQTCPACRSELVEEPYLNVHVQDMVNTLVDTCQKISSLSQNVLRDRALKVKQYKLDVTHDNLFKRVFKSTGHAVVDISDGVARCSNCHWEVRGNRCPNCHIHLRNTYIDEISSADTDFSVDDFRGVDLELESGDSSDDGFNINRDMSDGDGDFIDDRSIGEMEIADVNPELTDASRDSSPVRQPGRRYVPTFIDDDEPWEDGQSSTHSEYYETWNGFEDDVHQPFPIIDAPEDANSEDDEDCVSPRRRR